MPKRYKSIITQINTNMDNISPTKNISIKEFIDMVNIMSNNYFIDQDTKGKIITWNIFDRKYFGEYKVYRYEYCMDLSQPLSDATWNQITPVQYKDGLLLNCGGAYGESFSEEEKQQNIEQTNLCYCEKIEIQMVDSKTIEIKVEFEEEDWARTFRVEFN